MKMIDKDEFGLKDGGSCEGVPSPYMNCTCNNNTNLADVDFCLLFPVHSYRDKLSIFFITNT